MNRVSVPQLVALANEMPLHERQLVETVARLSLVSGRQLSDLFLYFSSPSSSSFPSPSSSFSFSVPAAHARRVRRVLAGMVARRVLDRLERRQGGVGGGSASWVYALGPAGRRMVAYWAGEGLPRSRSPHEPSTTWMAHTLAVSQLFVDLKAREWGGRLEILTFNAEPGCWRTYTRLGGAAGVLKPDAYVRLGVGDFEDSLFIEVDLGSEHRGQLTRQHRAYHEHYRAGVEQAKTGLYPGVLWIVPDAKRAALLAAVQRDLPAPARRLFSVTTADRALDLLCGDTQAARAGATT